MGTHAVVADSSVPQDSLAHKRHINGPLQEKEKRSYLSVLIAKRWLIQKQIYQIEIEQLKELKCFQLHETRSENNDEAPQ